MYTEQATDWQLSAETELPFDPLLECLVVLTKHFDNPYSHHALIAGLPLVNQKLTPELFLRAAERGKLSAKIVKHSLNSIDKALLPAVLLLKDNQACVLLSIDDLSNAQIIQPESGLGVLTVPLDELAQKYTGYALFTKPAYRFDSRANEHSSTSTKHWFWNVIRASWPVYSEVILASFLINLFALASPLFIRNVYDRVIPNKAIDTLWVLVIGVIIALIFDFTLRNIRAYFIDSIGKSVDLKLSRIIFERLLGMEMSSRPNSVGSLAHSVQSFDGFREFVTSATISTLVDVPFVIIFLSVIGLLAGNLVIVPLIAIPLVLFISLAIQLPLSRLIKDGFKHSAEKQAVLIESLACAETIKAMRAESPMQRRFEAMSKASAAVAIKTKLLSNLASNFALFAQYVASILIVIVGVYKISNGDITVGSLLACTILSARALSPITQIASLINRYQQAKSGLSAVNHMMNLPVERPAETHFIHRPLLQGSIEFSEVSFNYPSAPVPSLDSVSFKIKPGEHVGIIGRTGSGKTTIEKMMMKFYQPTTGRILIDGTELHQIDPAELRLHIGYVPQDVVLFHGSIKDNIVIGAPHVDDAAILRAAKLGGVMQFVDGHPEGFDRQVGERGDRLSGGQRQAIAIARALLLDPPILLMDEPSNGLDDTNTNQLMERLETILPSKTLILVTHKASLLKLVNRIIVVDNSVVLADGPKDVVLQQLSEGKLKVSANGKESSPA